MTGLSGSGKTTLAQALQEELKHNDFRVALIDGDVYRQTLCQDLGFSKTDRLENMKRLGAVADVLADRVDLVIIAAINPYEQGRLLLQEKYHAPLIYIDCGIETLIHRDPKGLYKRALMEPENPLVLKHFTGISDPFEIPAHFALQINTDNLSQDESLQKLKKFVLDKLNQQAQNKLLANFLIAFRKNVMAPSASKSMAKDFTRQVRVFLALFQLSTADIYTYLFTTCTSDEQFLQWLQERQGLDFFAQAALSFEHYFLPKTAETYSNKFLEVEQQEFWKENGFLQLSGLIPGEVCDAVKDLICTELGVDLQDSDTWYPSDPRLQGIMLFGVVDKVIASLRENQAVKNVFSDLYQTERLIPETMPLGYNPPENFNYTMRSTGIHWDIDFDQGERGKIQGLIYLQDVAENGGAFSLIPAYHQRLDELLLLYKTPFAAMKALQDHHLEKKLPGKKGDLILWMDATPHAAQKNYSCLPRFVQYVSFIM